MQHTTETYKHRLNRPNKCCKYFFGLFVFACGHNSVSFIIDIYSAGPLVREKLLSGKLLIEWRHDLCAEITKKRYITDQEVMRAAHAEIVNLFFPQESSDDSDEIQSENSDKSSEFLT